MNTPVSFELAKLLKEIGFISKTFMGYSYFQNTRKYKLITHRESKDFAAPTIAEVVMWLYEKHGFWINVNITRYGRFWCNIVLKEECKDLNNPFTWEFVNQLNDFTSPTQAYEAAIEHCLKRI